MIARAMSEKEMFALQLWHLITVPEMLSSDTPTGTRWKHIPERVKNE